MRVTLYFLICLAAQAYGYVGQWHSYTNKDHAACMQLFGGRLWVGTSGGIRNIDPASLEEKEYGNLDGLLEADIVALAVTPANRLWAASRGGFLYEWDGTRWQVYERSYVSERWRPNLRAAVAAGKYLALGTEKGLTFFDTDVKVARVNLTKFADQSNLSVLSVLRKGDTLFIGTEKGAFKAAVDWDNLLSSKYKSIFDPNTWIPIIFPQQVVPPPDTGSDSSSIVPADTVPRQFNHLVFQDGNLQSFPRGMVQYSPVDVEAILDRPLKIAGKSYSALSFFDVFALVGKKLFLGGPRLSGIILDVEAATPERPLFQLLPSAGASVPPESLFNVSATGGSVYAMSQYGLYGLTGEAWKRIPEYNINTPELLTRGLRNLAVDKDGAAYVGSWGSGLVREKNGVETKWDVGNNPCMDTVLTNYTVVRAMSGVRDGRIWAALLKPDAAASYSLVYLDLQKGTVVCPGQGGNGVATHTVKVFSDSIVSVSGEVGTDLYVFQKDNGGDLKIRPWKSIHYDVASESWDSEMDSRGRVWMLMGGKLAYADSLDASDPSPAPKTVEDFNGTDCRQLESDASGNFWVGCTNGLFRLVPAAVAEVSTSARFSLDDGLLSNNISDISVDGDNGHVWIATDLGISMYESDGRPPVTEDENIKVYPNPFLAKHRFVIFDNLPGGSQVRIYTQSGSVIRSFPPSQVKGGQCQWDGTNASKNKVTPGVYLYSVDGGGKTKHGKIIVAR